MGVWQPCCCPHPWVSGRPPYSPLDPAGRCLRALEAGGSQAEPRPLGEGASLVLPLFRPPLSCSTEKCHLGWPVSAAPPRRPQHGCRECLVWLGALHSQGLPPRSPHDWRSLAGTSPLPPLSVRFNFHLPSRGGKRRLNEFPEESAAGRPSPARGETQSQLKGGPSASRLSAPGVLGVFPGPLPSGWVEGAARGGQRTEATVPWGLPHPCGCACGRAIGLGGGTEQGGSSGETGSWARLSRAPGAARAALLRDPGPGCCAGSWGEETPWAPVPNCNTSSVQRPAPRRPAGRDTLCGRPRPCCLGTLPSARGPSHAHCCPRGPSSQQARPHSWGQLRARPCGPRSVHSLIHVTPGEHLTPRPSGWGHTRTRLKRIS
ncbi:uncharacterized protein LOC116663840 [Camelus ferus]|uniref:Uncharacterized protein LOC116663840 n=1 Tax=Camelus ferus TaxID=419612 RepID=A0A8B8T2Z7_CAMFR|nr:uncharacterized protein LOC116663840 [Camelus ferus]